jgi:hypothetical protein
MFIDPKTLVPKLPKPQDLQPFPQTLAMRFSGHTSRVRCISPHPSGQWLASGSDDGTVRLWEVATGRCSAKWKLGEAVMSVGWCPNASLQLLGAAVGKRVVLLLSGLGGEEVEAAARAACKVGKGSLTNAVVCGPHVAVRCMRVCCGCIVAAVAVVAEGIRGEGVLSGCWGRLLGSEWCCCCRGWEGKEVDAAARAACKVGGAIFFVFQGLVAPVCSCTAQPLQLLWQERV